jgi:hypothetical protein
MTDLMEPVAVETAVKEELHPDLKYSLREMGGCWMIHG